jgi:alginate O-acetyltransferase complex protein AlgI
MLFNSLQFVVFFLITTPLYYALPWRWQWRMLLAASCLFYMAFIPAYIFVLFSTILIDYIMALFIVRAQGGKRRLYLIVSIISTCAVLFVFKYSAFFGMSVRELQGLVGPQQSFPITHLILPIGLSFHTFQSLSYVIEVYRGHQEPERNFGLYSLYVMFYPQLVAGPIERPQNLLHQFRQEHRFRVENLTSGLSLIAWGMFQKMVIADRCATYVNTVYGHWADYSGLTLLIATLLFSVQIYCDFAGYSAIAIGCARVLGFDLMRNFNHPYFSSSVAEFWKRWHISLSTWFCDYLYIPLGGNRVSRGRHYFNLLVTFTISGLWHGANWTFIVWGAYNGILLIGEQLLGQFGAGLQDHALSRAVHRVVAMSAICLGWIFFRAPNLHAAVAILDQVFVHITINRANLDAAILPFTGSRSSVVVASVTLLLLCAMLLVELGKETGFRNLHRKFRTSRKLQFAGTLALCETVLLFGILRPLAFIYFQF